MRLDEDLLAGFGYLALGSRLKRLAEQLQAGVADVLSEAGESVPPGQLPLLAAIERIGSPTVAELVQALGMSQPGISRTLGALQRSGLVDLRADRKDARARRATLTPKAERMLASIRRRIFPKVAAAAEQLCDGLNLLDGLEVIEARNREKPFGRRIREAAP